VTGDRSSQPQPGRGDGNNQPVDAPEAPVSGFEEERSKYAAEHPDEGESPGGDEAERLEGDIAELQSKAAERDEYLALAQRAQADFENYRKRATKDVAAAEGRGMAKLARELLPALDNLSLALAAAESGAETEHDRKLVEGIRLVENELSAALARAGIEAYSPEGEPFDPELHEAMAKQPVEGVASGTVAEVYQRGYRQNGVILRPARVVVAE
jgi:molecular chaperone GrpE